jgi:hypothetical protein
MSEGVARPGEACGGDLFGLGSRVRRWRPAPIWGRKWLVFAEPARGFCLVEAGGCGFADLRLGRLQGGQQPAALVAREVGGGEGSNKGMAGGGHGIGTPVGGRKAAGGSAERSSSGSGGMHLLLPR